MWYAPYMNKPAAVDSFREEPARFTAEEFMQLATLGPLADVPGKFELVDGVIVHANSALNLHSKYQTHLLIQLASVYGDETPDGWVVRVELTVRLGDYSTRNPDIVVMRNPGDDEGMGQPDDVLLIIEIAHTTLKRDMGPKRLAYAAAGVPHYWVVDVEGRRTYVMADLADGDYCLRNEVVFGEAMLPPGGAKSVVVV